MLVPNRHEASESYRYGFNGMEKDDELKGEGNGIDYDKRFFDPRVGRFLSIDPLEKEFPWYTPYQFAGNTPIQAIDLDGAEEYHYTRTWVNGKPILKYSHKKDIYEYQWNPHKNNQSSVGFYLWERVKNPKKQYVAHEDRDGTWEEFDKVTFVTYDESWTYTSYDNMVNRKDGDYGGERYMHYAMKGLQAVNEEQRLQGGGGHSVLGAGRIVKALKKIKPCGCFTSGTQVYTETGYKNIEDIKIGDKVWAYNEDSKNLSLKEVIDTFTREFKQIYKIYFGDEVLEATHEHPFFIGGKWLKVDELKVGDLLTLYDGDTKSILKIELVEGDFKVYNFTVDEFHTYFVSKHNVLVHNGTPCNWKSVKLFSHTFSVHGSGKKITKSLTGRLETGNPQGQWTNNQKAADFLMSDENYKKIVNLKAGDAIDIDLPQGMGTVLSKVDGKVITSPATKVTVVRGSENFIKTAIPKN